MKKTKDNSKEKPCFMIKDYETLRVMTDPLRSKIFEMLIEEPLTIRQVAQRLGLSSSKLYYHVNMLEHAGLIKLIETRMVANLEEKVYQSTADCLEIDHKLLYFGKSNNLESGIQVLTSMLDTTREDVIRSLQARQTSLDQGEKPHPRRVIVNREVEHLTEEQVKDFEQKLDTLILEFEKAGKGRKSKDGTPSYALTVAFYPSYYYKEGEDRKD
jgi:predicted transcriptional regulator